MKGEGGEEITGWETEHGESELGFSEATQDALKRARERKPGLRRIEVILQEVVEESPQQFHVIVRFPTN
jgi:hypothetical protein